MRIYRGPVNGEYSKQKEPSPFVVAQSRILTPEATTVAPSTALPLSSVTVPQT